MLFVLWCVALACSCVFNVFVRFRCDLVCDAARFEFVCVCCVCACVPLALFCLCVVVVRFGVMLYGVCFGCVFCCVCVCASMCVVSDELCDVCVVCVVRVYVCACGG